ncbi:MAG: flagellin lysine-N-methylase [Clostridia bacterium]|nr:flagellin lysine-N-methylase [Clostridia bacterium]
MKLIVPNYYENFKCIADRCRHNCCIGWEIDIDKETLDFYRQVGGKLGKRLKEHISPENTPHFILNEQERCPFLNSRNLCDIITQLGEGGLCQICDDHPRFRNYYSDRIEMGIGLCCEAAGQLILSQQEKVTFSPIRSKDPFFRIRKQVFTALQDRSKTVEQRLKKMLVLCGSDLDPNLQDWAMFYKNLERLDPAWDQKLEQIQESSPLPMEWDIPFEQLSVYFAFRHLQPEQLAKRAAFVALSVKLIAAIFSAEEKTFDGLVELARLYSSEIEYSDENIERILDRIT